MRHIDDRRDRALDVVLLARQLTEHPASEDLLERAVDRPRRHLRVDVGTHLAAIAPRLDDALQRMEEPADLVDARAALGAPSNPPHQPPYELGRDEPRAEIDAREPAQL